MSYISKISELMVQQDKIRNIALVAHIDHGKTTLSDSLLASSGFLAPSTAGEARALDFLPEEQRRGITMKTANISLLVKNGGQNYLLNLIDSPGHVDFSGKVARALRIADGAIVVVDAVEQIMAQTETVIRQCITEGVKPILFINKIDRLINELKITSKEIAERIEIIYNNFNALVAKYSSKTSLPNWKSTTKDGSVIFGSALHKWALSVPIANELKITFADIVKLYQDDNKEKLQELLPIERPLIDMIIKHLPNPKEAQKYRIQNIWKGDTTSNIGKAMINCEATNNETPAIFDTTKLLYDKHAGILILGRIFSGILREKTNVNLINLKEKRKINNIYVFMGSDKKKIASVPAGNIVAISGLGQVNPGETIVNIETEMLVPFEEIKYIANPVVTIAIEPEMLRDLAQLKHVIERYDLEDPNLLVKIDDLTGEILLMGLGELHLETVVKEISNEIKCSASDPIVVIVEKIAKSSEEIISELYGTSVKLKVMTSNSANLSDVLEGKYKQILKINQYSNSAYVNSGLLAKLPSETVENIVMGINNALTRGPIASKPVTETVILIDDFKFENNEKFEHTVPLLRNAVWDALKNALLSLQEPIYKIQVTVPTMYLGKVTSILNKRRGEILDIRAENDLLVISGIIPVAESFGIDHNLRSDTEGRAFWQMSFERYETISKQKLKEF